MFWTFAFTMAKAQPNLAFYPLTDQFNSFDYNPAFLTSSEKFTLSMFPVSGTSIGYNNQEIINDLASKFFKGLVTNQDYKNMFNNMVNKSSFHQNMESSLLSFTYHSDIGFFNFRIKDSQYFTAKVEGDVTKFMFNSNIRSVAIGQIQHLPSQAAHYREYSLGYAYQSRSHQLTAGIRAKLYFGKFAFFSNISGAIQKAENADGYFLKTSGLLHISFPETVISNADDTIKRIDFSTSKVFDYLWNTGNPGMGVDLGVNYQLTPEWSFSMSIIDLGKINWKSNINSRNLDESYSLQLLTYDTLTVDGVQTIIKKDHYSYSDSIDFSNLKHERTPFSKSLPFNMYAGIKYQVNPSLSLNLTDKFVGIKDLSYNSLSVTANYAINKKLSICAGYSMIGDSYLNFPLALLYKGDRGQFFLGTDNLTTLFLSNAEYAGINFGACFYLFTKRNLYLKTSDQIPFYQPRKIIKNQKSGQIIQENTD